MLFSYIVAASLAGHALALAPWVPYIIDNVNNLVIETQDLQAIANTIDADNGLKFAHGEGPYQVRIPSTEFSFPMTLLIDLCVICRMSSTDIMSLARTR